MKYWAISRLNAYEKNPRKNDSVVNKIRASIREFGFVIPILARSSDGQVIDGHLRLKGAIAEGMTEVPVIACDNWTEAQVKAFRLVANRSANWAEWDTDMLRTEILDLKGFDFNLELTGFEALEIDNVLNGRAVDDKPSSRKRNGSAPASAGAPVLSYLIVFSSEEEQQTFFTYLKQLRTAYPEIPNAGTRIAKHCKANPPQAGA